MSLDQAADAGTPPTAGHAGGGILDLPAQHVAGTAGGDSEPVAGSAGRAPVVEEPRVDGSGGGAAGSGTGGTSASSAAGGANAGAGTGSPAAGAGAGTGGASASAGAGGGEPAYCSVCTADYPCQNPGPTYTCRGQFADWPPAYSPSTFTVNGDGTVTDSRSGLVWQRTLPATYAGCSGKYPIAGTTGDACTRTEAVSYCAGLSLAGTGWRLPTKAELESIVDDTRSGPAISATLFPDTPSQFFWSSSTYGSAGYLWGVDFNDGTSSTSGPDASIAFRVRCVQSSAPVLPSLSGSGGAPPDRYRFPTADTVYDSHTKLTWQRDLDAGTYAQQSAASYCLSLPLAQGGWRLPTRAELLTLVDPTKYRPAIGPTAFPDTPSEWFWSSSTYVGSSGSAWEVNFGAGLSAYSDVNTTTNRVRCVR